MNDPQVVWRMEKHTDWPWDAPAIVMTPEYRAELRRLVSHWHSTGRTGGYDLAAAIERMLEATDG